MSQQLLEKFKAIQEMCNNAISELQNTQQEEHPEKPKSTLAATYEEVAEAVSPKYTISILGGSVYDTTYYPYAIPTEAAAKQARAYIQIKNLEAYCAVKFPGKRNCTVDAADTGGLFLMECTYATIKVTREAADWIIKNHPEPFLIFFGVK